MAIKWDMSVERRGRGAPAGAAALRTTQSARKRDAAAEYLVKVLTDAGIEAEIVGVNAERGNVIGRLRAENPTKRPLLLTGHIDVVSVERDKWPHDPFGGEIIDGDIWGRGALDMKGQVAAELTVMLLLKRTGGGARPGHHLRGLRRRGSGRAGRARPGSGRITAI